jgi:hypothetical protein
MENSQVAKQGRRQEDEALHLQNDTFTAFAKQTNHTLTQYDSLVTPGKKIGKPVYQEAAIAEEEDDAHLPQVNRKEA